MLHLRFRYALVFSLAASCLADTQDYHWPSPQYDALEALLYEGRRGDGSSLASIQHPCRKRPDSEASIGAEWLRFAFHDMATHDNSDGSGGLDGSIAYELDRAANFGVGFSRTLIDFELYPNKYISRFASTLGADVIAVGAVLSVASCGGPVIPFRGGRIDAWKAGPDTTPEAQQDIATHTEMFRRQGFSPSEMIKLVACGHTIGSVRSTDTPQLVPPGPNPAIAVFVDFDSTTQFDNKVVTEYLDGTTQNPLVVGMNKTMTSDLRVFSLDSNDTMRSIASPTSFATECQNIFERMLNVVPHGVSLTQEITLLPVKVHDVQLTFERNKFVFKASLRLVQPLNTNVNKNRTVQIMWCDRYGSAKNCKGSTRSSSPASTLVEDPDISPVSKVQGYYFVNYNFVVPVDAAASVAKFWFQVDNKDGKPVTVHNNNGSGYLVEQDQLLFVPTLSQVVSRTINPTKRGGYSDTNSTYTKDYTIVAAVRDGSNPSRVYMDAHDFAIHAFPAPFNTTVDLKLNTSLAPLQGYSFYTATVEDQGLQLTVDIHSVAADGTIYIEDFKQTTFLDNTPYFAPTAAATIATSSSSSWRLIDGWQTVQRSTCGIIVTGLLLRTVL